MSSACGDDFSKGLPPACTFCKASHSTVSWPFKGRIFISKAVILLSLAKKSRDADHLQNLVYDALKGIDPDKLANELRKAPEYQPIPDYAYDSHTQEGRKRGKTKADFFKAEQKALSPFIPGLFDGLIDD